MTHDSWNDSIIEKALQPAPLSDDRLRAWLTDSRIFISSRMDDELNPARDAVRLRLQKMGAISMMDSILL